jgi:hypothetical protein
MSLIIDGHFAEDSLPVPMQQVINENSFAAPPPDGPVFDEFDAHSFKQEDAIMVERVESLPAGMDSEEDEKSELNYPSDLVHSEGDVTAFIERCAIAAKRLCQPIGMRMATDPQTVKATNVFRMMQVKMAIVERPQCYPGDTAADATEKTHSTFSVDTSDQPVAKRQKGRPPKRKCEFYQVLIPDEAGVEQSE